MRTKILSVLVALLTAAAAFGLSPLAHAADGPGRYQQYEHKYYDGDSRDRSFRTGPTIFEASEVDGAVTLKWTKAPWLNRYRSVEAGHDVYRRSSGGEWNLIDSTGRGVREYTDTPGGDGTFDYFVRVFLVRHDEQTVHYSYTGEPARVTLGTGHPDLAAPSAPLVVNGDASEENTVTRDHGDRNNGGFPVSHSLQAENGEPIGLTLDDGEMSLSEPQARLGSTVSFNFAVGASERGRLLGSVNTSVDGGTTAMSWDFPDGSSAELSISPDGQIQGVSRDGRPITGSIEPRANRGVDVEMQVGSGSRIFLGLRNRPVRRAPAGNGDGGSDTPGCTECGGEGLGDGGQYVEDEDAFGDD